MIPALTSGRTKDAARRQMEARGYVYDETSPDLWVNLNAYMQEKTDVVNTPEVDYDYYYSYRARRYLSVPYWRDRTEVYQYTEGTMNVDLVDAAQNRLVWTGVAVGRLRSEAMTAIPARNAAHRELAAAAGICAVHLSRLAEELVLWTTQQFRFVRLSDAFSTGSSIMPQKRNPDVIELMRATHASVSAARSEIEQLLSLPSGYHRDLQASKGAIFHGFGRGLPALELLPALLANLEWRGERLRAAIDSGMYATDVAVEAAVAGVPFREAYKAAAASADSAGQGRTPEGSLAARIVVYPTPLASMGLLVESHLGPVPHRLRVGLPE